MILPTLTGPLAPPEDRLDLLLLGADRLAHAIFYEHDTGAVREACRRAALAIDRALPDDPHWPHRVNIARLKLWDGSLCVLGQVFAHDRRYPDLSPYLTGYELLDADPAYENVMGVFSCDDVFAEPWRDLLRALQASRPLFHTPFDLDTGFPV